MFFRHWDFCISTILPHIALVSFAEIARWFAVGRVGWRLGRIRPNSSGQKTFPNYLLLMILFSREH
jgi:hypothetical protein